MTDLLAHHFKKIFLAVELPRVLGRGYPGQNSTCNNTGLQKSLNIERLAFFQAAKNTHE